MKRVFLKMMGGIHTALYRATGGKFGGTMVKVPILLLTTRGRRSGKERTTPLMFTRDGDNLVLVASVGRRAEEPRVVLEPPGTGRRRADRLRASPRTRP
jgi:F420H(2)-dependent quinone reductase